MALAHPRRARAALALLLVVAVAAVASAAAAADNASASAAAADTTVAHSGNKNKNKGNSNSNIYKYLEGPACVRATGERACAACAPFATAPPSAAAASSTSNGRKHGGGGSTLASPTHFCTQCAGEAYMSDPVAGACTCAGGYGYKIVGGGASAASSDSGALSSSSSSTAHGGKSGKGKSGGGGNANRGLVPPCVLCPAGTASGEGEDFCATCASGLTSSAGALSCAARCVPVTCASAGATCGSIVDPCSGATLQCGTCPGDTSCDPATGSCSCPDGSAPGPNGSCLFLTSYSCDISTKCQSGVCDDSTCVEACPPLSAPQGVTGCQCVAGAYSTDGKAPCTACGGDSNSATAGATACTCASPRVWLSDSNTCACPSGYWADGECKPIGGRNQDTCSSNSECASGLCVAGTCSARGCPVGTAPSGDSACLCGPDTYSDNGEVAQGGCTPCGAGSTAPNYGSTSCVCSVPTGSVWSESSNTCVCVAPDTANAGNTACLLRENESCKTGTQCATGLCSRKKCSVGCGPGAGPNAKGTCRCLVDFFGPGGVEPCAPCPGASTTAGKFGQSSCVCPAGSGTTWSKKARACVCPDGQVASLLANGACKIDRGYPCTSGGDCASGICSELRCADSCPANSQVAAGGSCNCTPGSFGPDGGPPCTPCGTGSYSASAGSTSCTCSEPVGSSWTGGDTNTCVCNAGEELSADGTTCLTSNGGPCSQGSTCRSGICGGAASGGTCVASCGTGAQVVGGLCACSAGFYGPEGAPPCTACGGGSTSTGTGNAICDCDATKGLTWAEDANACVCPPGQAVAADGKCRITDGNTCNANADCLSNLCTNNLCSSGCTPPKVLSSDGTSCVCKPGSYLTTGNTCVICGPGSTSTVPINGAARACRCSSPTGSSWTSGTNTCDCPAGTTAANGVCKTNDGGSCSGGSTCASGLCDGATKKCIASCPANSIPDGTGGCKCAANYYGPNGKTPCKACRGASSSVAGSSVCSCRPPSVWSELPNAWCECPPGQSFDVTILNCVCDPTTCSPACPNAPNPTCPNAGESCVAGVCQPADPGSKCIGTRGECGACAADCSSDANAVCAAYGYARNGCTVKPTGDTGRCGGGLKCCIVSGPKVILPGADRKCSPPGDGGACAAGQINVGGECLSENGRSCSQGGSCASGLCDGAACVASCTSPDVPDGLGGCKPPCPPGQTLVGTRCLTEKGGPCTGGSTCSTGLCHARQCVASCPPRHVPSSGECLPNAHGEKCTTNAGLCGACVNNCGNEADLVCGLFGLSKRGGCKVNARGGGGRCAGTVVCCVVSDPEIRILSDGTCPATYAGR